MPSFTIRSLRAEKKFAVNYKKSVEICFEVCYNRLVYMVRIWKVCVSEIKFWKEW